MEDDRFANVVRSAAGTQGDLDRTDTLGWIAILEDKCAEVMANNQQLARRRG